MNRFFMRCITVFVSACCLAAVSVSIGHAAESTPSTSAFLASPAMTGASQDDRENVEIALRFVDSSRAVPTFDRLGAEAAGLDKSFASDFAATFDQTVAELGSSRSPADANARVGAAASIFPAWFNCAVAIASMAGATVAAVAAIFASGGTLAFALVTYGLSSVGVLGSCYDANGRPVI